MVSNNRSSDLVVRLVSTSTYLLLVGSSIAGMTLFTVALAALPATLPITPSTSGSSGLFLETPGETCIFWFIVQGRQRCASGHLPRSFLEFFEGYLPRPRLWLCPLDGVHRSLTRRGHKGNKFQQGKRYTKCLRHRGIHKTSERRREERREERRTKRGEFLETSSVHAGLRSWFQEEKVRLQRRGG